ncbi:putative bifunctional diguanylate cyclase/phosphodiesterase [Bosea sp. Root483D1]|uniref:putative bifunctional diguanylate cyclase/phosphodiesterase n=1 Tax=Bosea sp. Root483D1 TaxID=1736544 RepID=UPI0009EB2495|nr:GGDEF domain-containing phosphodiesterase [Bosea sp. Root483D1]
MSKTLEPDLVKPELQIDQRAYGHDQLTLKPDLTSLLDLSTDGVLVGDLHDNDCALIYVNPAFERITGYTKSEAIGKNCRYLQGGDRLQPEIERLREAIDNRRSVCVTLRNYRKDGQMFWNELRLTPINIVDGRPAHYLGLMRDVTVRKRALDHVEQNARIDLLTGALNRNAFADELTRLAGEKSAPMLVAKIDVAGFHEINSGYGYDAGDAVLRQIAERIRSVGFAIVSRTGSNEFAVVQPLGHPNNTLETINLIRSALASDFLVSGATINIRFAIGFVVGVSALDGTKLMRQADSALRRSKSSNFLDVSEFKAEDEMRSRNRIRMTREMQQALENDEFGFQYQPKIDLSTGAIAGGEALLRWRHGLFGTQLPGSFISHAEDTGLILEISRRGLRAVADFAARINQGRSRALNISINVSAIEFRHRDMPAFVDEVISASSVDPRWITLELTESKMAESSPAMIAIMTRLRSLGVGLSIDDFGTGYANLRYLEEFPITELKIDRSFIRGLGQSRSKNIIVEAIVRLSDELGFQIVAEGIETQEECARLRDLGCHFGQGFLFGKAIDPEAFAEVVAQTVAMSATRTNDDK